MMFASKRRAVSVDICAEVEMCYRDKRYSDLEIRCGKGNLDDRVVYCHRLIMAAVAPKLRDVLRLSDDSELPAVLQIPDFEPAKVSKCVDSIYSAIASGDCSLAEVVLDREVAEFFGLDENSNAPMFLHSEYKRENTEAITKVEADLEDLEPLRMRRRKRRKRKTIDELDEFVAGEDFFQGLEDINHEEICEPKVGRKRKGRSMSAEEAQAESAAEKQCVDCGVVLAYATKKDKQRFRDHMVVHERERFTCDCDCEFADSNAKRRHILLVHSEGKYVKCAQCAFIGTAAAVERHTANNHKSYVCDVCGKTTPTKAALSVHAMDHKMYHCDQGRNKTDIRVVKSLIQCNIDILGRHKFARHMDTTHSGTWPCEKCGAMFKSRAYLQKHTLIMHQRDEDKPHRCGDCGKGFVGSNALKTHMMNVHIKARPYACRYGCGAAYNDSSNRGHHERKKHGGNYTPAAAAAISSPATTDLQIHHQLQR